MRQHYDALFGILLILSIIDFALAAPLLVQEKRHAYVDVVRTPRDVVTVLGERAGGDEEFVNVVYNYLNSWRRPVTSES